MTTSHTKDVLIHHVHLIPPEEKVWGAQVPTVWPDMVQRKQLGGDGPIMHDMPHHGPHTLRPLQRPNGPEDGLPHRSDLCEMCKNPGYNCSSTYIPQEDSNATCIMT